MKLYVSFRNSLFCSQSKSTTTNLDEGFSCIDDITSLRLNDFYVIALLWLKIIALIHNNHISMGIIYISIFLRVIILKHEIMCLIRNPLVCSQSKSATTTTSDFYVSMTSPWIDDITSLRLHDIYVIALLRIIALRHLVIPGCLLWTLRT